MVRFAMADEHRRVESRGVITGTGMATDPERIRQLADEAERKKRSWRDAPVRGFSDVLSTAPAQGVLADDDEEADKRKRGKKEAAPVEAAMATGALTAGSPDAAAAATPARGDAPTKRLPPDPREAFLRKKLAQAQASPPRGMQVDTPPTGSRARKPT